MTTPAQKRANERQDKKRRRQLRLSDEALEVVDTNRREGESASRCASRLILSKGRGLALSKALKGHPIRGGEVVTE